jgi:chromate transporter
MLGSMSPGASTELRSLAALFLRLGATSFGGPAAHVALMHDEVVRRRAWLGEREFLDLLSAANLIPGPNSTELAIHIGYRRAGWRGLVVAGLCFLLPAVAITGALAWAYVAYGERPTAQWLLAGVKPAVLAVVVLAIARLWPVALATQRTRVLAAGAVVALWLGAHELAVLAGCGVLAMGWPSGRVAALLVVPVAAAAGAQVTLAGLFWVFFRICCTLFGSGYVLLAFLRSELVVRLGWLTDAQVVDAVAMGQVTPGPVFSTATFVGYVLAGPAGAAAATAGIFLPAFLFVAVSGPWLERVRRSPRAMAALDGVNAASLALMVVVACQLAGSAITDGWSGAIAVLSAVLLWRWRCNGSWLVVGGGLLGWLGHWMGVSR